MNRLLNPSQRALASTVVLSGLSLGFHWTGYVYVFFGASLAAFGWLVVSELSDRRLTAPGVVVAGAIVMALAIAFPMRTSRDIHAYASYGKMIAAYRASPYANVPSDFPGDFWYSKVNRRWRHTGSVYGPVFAGAAGLIMRVARDSELVARLAFQSFAALVVAAIAALVWWRTRDPTALAMIVVNPLVTIGVVNGGHNDTLVALGVLAAVLALERGRSAAAGVALGVAALVKVVAALPAAALAYWLWRRRSLGEAVKLGVPFVTVLVAGLALAGGLVVLQPLRAASELVSFSSFWHAILKLVSGGTFRGPSAETGRAIVRVLSEITVIAMGAYLVVKSRSAGLRRVTSMAILAYLLAASYVLPWYAMWVLPLVALAWRSRESMIALGYAAFLSMSYFPLSERSGPAIVALQKLFTGAMAPVELAAIVLLVRSTVTRDDGALQRAA